MEKEVMIRRDFLGGGAALIALSACGAAAPRYPAFRYRLTVEVDTPEGLKTGSSVIEVKTYEASEYSIPRPGLLSTRVRGEAVAVDLPGGQTLFALLRSKERLEWAGGIVFVGVPTVPYKKDENQFAERFDLMLAQREEKVIPADAYPMLVRFRNTAEPISVEAVDAAALGQSFGPGVKLRRMTVQLTDEPVTMEIDKRLPWLSEYPEPSLNPSHGPKDYSLSATIKHGDIRQLAR